MYKDCSIPAKLFFKVASGGDLKLLPEGTDWDAINDEYFILRKDGKTRQILEKQKTVAYLILKANVIQDVLYCLNKFKSYKEYRDKIIEMLKQVDVFIKSDTLEKDILRALNVTLGRIKNQIRLEELYLKDKQKEVGVTFEQVCVSIENVLERTINEEMSLYKFIAYETACNEKIQQLKKQKVKKKK